MPEDGYMLLTIPYDSQWKIEINGKSVRALKGIGSLILLPVQSGENCVRMSYQLPGKITGGVLSVLAIGAWIGRSVYYRGKGKSYGRKSAASKKRA